MKKHKILFNCSIALTAALMAGCTSNLNRDFVQNTTPAPETEVTTEVAAQTAAEGELLTGFSVITTIDKSKDAGEADGLAQVDSAVVALTIDSEGKIADCIIDGVQSKINFSKEGKLLTDINTTFEPKSILGDKYGMKAASKIGKEWNEQAAALAEYVTGKTIEEVTGIATTPEGAPADADLAASVTFGISGSLDAIKKAAANAQNLGAKEGDRLGLGISTQIKDSTDAADGANGIAQAYTTYSTVTFNSEGTITSCYIDASQTNVNFDSTGKITSDLSAPIQSKNELKENYGMKVASKIGKEWYQEADAFAKYTVGKTVDEVNNIAIDAEEGAPSDPDLSASVTIGIGDFKDTITKAAENAK